MKILHYLPGLPLVMQGGMIKYALDLVRGESQADHEVIMLVPGHFTHFHKDNTRIIKANWNGKECYRIINSLPVSGGKGVTGNSEFTRRGNRDVYVSFLEKMQPDIIHIHSFMGMHVAFLEAAAQLGIPIVYTTHDYYGICPKAILLNNMEQCEEVDGSRCAFCIDKTISIKRLKWKQSILYEKLKNNSIINFFENSQIFVPIKIYIGTQLKNIREKKVILGNALNNVSQDEEYKAIQKYYKEMFGYVTKFHFNSMQSEEMFSHYLGRIEGDVIPISNINVIDRRKKRNFGKTLKIGFIGRGAYKGFDLLKDALDGLYKEGLRDFECHIYFNSKEKLPSYFMKHEPYKENLMDQLYDSMDILVLPSIWRETFGLVVLEALSYGVPVIVSENVGAKEWVEKYNNVGIIVKSTKASLQKALENVYCNRDIVKRMNLEICSCEMELSFEKHVCKILEMYQTVSFKSKSG